MKLPPRPHSWNLSPRRAMALQARLAGRIVRRPLCGMPRLIAGGDAAYLPGSDRMVAGWVVWDSRTREAVEAVVVIRPVRFPYVPGLLSFREAPALLAAARLLSSEPDVFMLDGQGLAHPRRFGLACHVGLLLGRPTLGCAKSRLCGRHAEPASRRGASAPLRDGREVVGRVVRTRDGCRPVYVSIGHLITLADAVRVALGCCKGFRIPEPTRLADHAVSSAISGLKR